MTVRRRRAATEITRQRLVDAAAHLFAVKGYDFTLQEVAQRAGLTTGAIYSNFPDKMGLFAAVMARVGEETIRQVAVETKARGGGRSAKATLLARLGTRLISRQPESSMMLLEALVAARRDSQVQEFMHARIAWWAEEQQKIIGRAQADGDIDDHLDPAAIARLTQALTLGSLLLDAVGAEPPPGQHWEAVVARVVAALGPAD